MKFAYLASVLSLLPVVVGSVSFTGGCGGKAKPSEKMAERPSQQKAKPGLSVPEEVHLSDVRQLTKNAGENAEAYWSSDGKDLIFQSKRPPYKCDQIMLVPADGSSEPSLVSTGKGRTTCGYFFPGDKRTVWSSTHLASEECPPEPSRTEGYVWPIYGSYEIFTSDPDGSDIVQLTKNKHYDAEATVCPLDGSILFTSTRDGDLDLYRMDKDGKNVKRLTQTMGYDGGGFFSSDCKSIVWRASRPKGKALDDYKSLLAKGLVRPSQLELFVADRDGKNPRQVTYLGAASFAPYFHPSNKRILFSTNYPNPRGREFDIYAIDVDGSNLERVTYAEGFDGFPMFSPDGKQLAFGSNRNQANPGETDVYVANWSDSGSGKRTDIAATSFIQDVQWLASDKRKGRGLGSPELAESARWLANRMKEAGLTPGAGDGFLQSFEVIDSVFDPASTVSIGETPIAVKDYVVPSFSAAGSVKGKTISIGYGLFSKEKRLDDFRGKKLKGRIVVIKRFLPKSLRVKNEEERRRLTDLHHKAYLARERGAAAVVFVDERISGDAELPKADSARNKKLGIPVLVARGSVARKLLSPKGGKSKTVSLDIRLKETKTKTKNVVGVVRAQSSQRNKGAIIVGAHYDHLGMGGRSSLENGDSAVHNGADDNASGVAGLLAAARAVAKEQGSLTRDVFFIGFTGEESGLLGSSHIAENLGTIGLEKNEVAAMLNLDMIGRMRANTVAVIGSDTAREWENIVTTACGKAKITCKLRNGGYGPSDHTPFYANGAPVLHFFTGSHGDYHKSTDDSEKVNAAGGAQIALAVAGIAEALASDAPKLSYQRLAAPAPKGDTRSGGGASMGTIPDYTDDTGNGVLLGGVRPGSPAEKAGLKKGDTLLRIGSKEVRSVQDFVYVLRSARPGQKVKVVFKRGGKNVTTNLVFGKPSRRLGR